MDTIQRDATEPDGLAAGGRRLHPQVQETLKMRSLIFRTALAALLISTPFASAFARGGGMGGGGMGGFHSGQSIGGAMGGMPSGQSVVGSHQNFTGRVGRNSNRINLPRSTVGPRSRSFTSGAQMDENSVGQSTATPGNTNIRVR